MASPALPCDSCGSPIADSDLETGTAVTLLGKRYCVGCKTEAIQGVSLDQLGGWAAPKPAPRPAPRPATPPAPPPPERKAAAPRRTPAAAPASSRKPLVIAAGAVVAVVAVAAVIVLLTRSSPPEPAAGPVTPRTGPAQAAVAPPDRDAQARDAYARVDALVRGGGASWDHLLAAIEKAKPTCRGTSWEKKLEELRIRALHEKEADDASRELAPLLDELKGAVATDPEFKRFSELQSKFRMALEMAGKTASPKMAEIRTIQKDYNGRYEKLAEPHYAEIHEAATQLAEERRYDDALRKIDTFPQPLRLSGAWINLEKLRQDIVRRKKDAAPKKK
jgi:hypothetical protein